MTKSEQREGFPGGIDEELSRLCEYLDIDPESIRENFDAKKYSTSRDRLQLEKNISHIWESPFWEPSWDDLLPVPVNEHQRKQKMRLDLSRLLNDPGHA